MKKFISTSLSSNYFYVSDGNILYRVNYFPENNDRIVITKSYNKNGNLEEDSVFGEGRDFVYFSDVLDICNFLRLAYKLGVHICNKDQCYLYNSVKYMFDSMKD